MNDVEILKQIENLVDEERELREKASTGQGDPDAHTRLQSLEVNLDRCWDLLRQRRAKREFGENPDEAAAGAVHVCGRASRPG
jgi:Protein of unknown function (DUF2630)